MTNRTKRKPILRLDKLKNVAAVAAALYERIRAEEDCLCE